MWFVPSHNSAKIQSKFSNVYLYYFSYPREQSLANFILAMKGKYPVMLEIIYSVLSSWVKQNVFGITLPHHGVCHGKYLKSI